MPVRPHAPGAKIAPTRRWGLVWRYARGQWPALIGLGLFALLTPLITAMSPWPIKILLDHALGELPAPPWLDRLVSLLPADGKLSLVIIAAGMSLALFVLSSAIESVSSLIWTVAGERMVRRLSSDLFERMQQLSLRFHGRNTVGDLLSRLSGDTWGVYGAAEGLLIAPVQQILTILIVTSLAWRLDPLLTIISISIAPLLGAAAIIFGPKLQRRSRFQRQGEAQLMSFVHQTLGAIPLVQAFDSARRHSRQFDDLAGRAASLGQRGVVLRNALALVTGLTTALGLAAVICIGSTRVLSGALTAGGLLVFIAYYRNLQSASQGLLRTYGSLKSVQANLDRVIEVLDSSHRLPQKSDAQSLDGACHLQRGLRVTFDHVTFAYDIDRPALREVSLDIAPGETIALVGPTGAGKSTLAALIPRLFDPQQGHVRISGVDSRDLDLSSLRRHVAVVPQEAMLIAGTIAENIGFARPDATRDEIAAAARAAQASDFIQQLPQGYDTVIAESGATLSGGQRQLIAIARALLKNAPVLILDEPSASLDAQTESALQKVLAEQSGRCTCIIIAHRLSTVRHADRIFVLNQGRVVQSGTHEQLTLADGLYRQLHHAASNAEVCA